MSVVFSFQSELISQSSVSRVLEGYCWVGHFELDDCSGDDNPKEIKIDLNFLGGPFGEFIVQVERFYNYICDNSCGEGVEIIFCGHKSDDLSLVNKFSSDGFNIQSLYVAIFIFLSKRGDIDIAHISYLGKIHCFNSELSAACVFCLQAISVECMS